MLNKDDIIFSTTNVRIDDKIKWIARIEFKKPESYEDWDDITKILNVVFSTCTTFGWSLCGTFDGENRYYMNFLLKGPDDAEKFRSHIYNELMWR